VYGSITKERIKHSLEEKEDSWKVHLLEIANHY
jgi:hypothetical protein